jgi:hypothetical protein
VVINKPSAAAKRPFKSAPFDNPATRVRAKRISAVISQGRKFMLKLAISGPKKTSTATLIIVPRKEAITPMPRALPGSPFWAIG